MNQPDKLELYLDTSVISAYFDHRTPSRQEETQTFWRVAERFKLVVSTLVFEEIEKTPQPKRREEMLTLIGGYPVLGVSDEADRLALDFADENLVPAKKFEDAQHLAVAVIRGCNFLVSWNFRHMVNYRTMDRLPRLAAKNGYFKPLTITTPTLFANEWRGDDPR